MGGMGGMGGFGAMGGGYGGGMGPYGGAGLVGPMGAYGADPNDPNGGPPPQAPNFWQNMLRAMHGVMSFFGRLSILVDENTHALHFFITALLQLFDRAGVLYGELARFVLKLLGLRARRRKLHKSMPGMPDLDAGQVQAPLPSAPAKFALPAAGNSKASWDSLWADDTAKLASGK
eukprot:SM000055S18215  [mRNA]  locus=s55:29133:30034:- [translate_table: standard]